VTSLVPTFSVCVSLNIVDLGLDFVQCKFLSRKWSPLGVI